MTKTHGQQKICQNSNFDCMTYLEVYLNSIYCRKLVSKDELHRSNGSWDIAFWNLKSMKLKKLRKWRLKSKIRFFIKLKQKNSSLPFKLSTIDNKSSQTMLLDKIKWKQSDNGSTQAISLYFIHFFADFGMLFI